MFYGIDMHIRDGGQCLWQTGELKIMGGKQTQSPIGLGEVFSAGHGQG